MTSLPLPALVHATIQNHSLLVGQVPVLVAVSGGPDSVALLHALCALGYDVHAAHLNHGLRGQEAQEDAAYVQSLCKKLRVPLRVGEADIRALQRQSKISIQEAARRARYAFLEETARSLGIETIATAHTQDDQAETVLLNILRGTGPDGLSGIPYRRAKIIRPLLDTPRALVEDYCAENGLTPRRDSSNNSRAYARNNVRQELIPYLERRYNPSVRASILRLSAIAGEEGEYLQNDAAYWLEGREKLPVIEFLRLPAVMKRRVLREWLRAARGDLADISYETIERLRGEIGGRFTLTLPGGSQWVCGDETCVTLEKQVKNVEFASLSLPFPIPGRVAFFDWTLEADRPPPGTDLATLAVRTWQPGDRIALPIGSKKIQDVFTDAKIPRAERHSYPLIADSLGIVCAPNLCMAQRAAGWMLRASKSPRAE